MTREALVKVARSFVGGCVPLAVAMTLASSCETVGYYANTNDFTGDFVTLPEITGVFGLAVGRWIGQFATHFAGQVNIVEMGAGSGKFMAGILSALDATLGAHNINIFIVETSQALAGKQQATLVAHAGRVHWVKTIDDIPHATSIVVSNEFFDALPIYQFFASERGILERCIVYNRDSDVFIDSLVRPVSIAPLASAIAILGRQYGVAEVSMQALAVMESLMRIIKERGGYFLAFDYGYEHAPLQSTLDIVHRHGRPYDLAQVCQHKNLWGAVDISAHVDFGALKSIALRHGLATSLESQCDFLSKIGFFNAIDSLTDTAVATTIKNKVTAMSTFKALSVTAC